MTEYFLINAQDYFAASYTISRGQVYVDTTGGLETAVACNAADTATAKAELYRRVLAKPAAHSERTELTEAEKERLIAKLDEQFKAVGTDELASC